MFRLLRYELMKIWKRPFFLACVFVMFTANILLLWYSNSNYTVPSSAYQKITQELALLDQEERTEFIEKQWERVSALYALRQIDLISAGMGEMGNAQIELLKEENPNLENYRDEYQNGITLQYTNSIEEEKVFWDDIKENSVTQEEYTLYLSEIQKDSNTLLGISIFTNSGEETYEQKSIQQTANQYRQLGDISVCPGQSKGFLSATGSISTDLILLLLLMLFSALAIFDEKQKGLFPLIRSMSNGRQETILAKIFTLICSAGFLTILFWSSNLIYSGFTFGVDDCTRSLQSIANFIGCPYSISIIEYLILFFLTKWFVYTVFCIGVLLIAILFERVSTVGFVITAILGIEGYLYFGIDPLSQLRILRICNVFNIMQTNDFYATYSTVSIFDEPISAIFTVWSVLTFLGLLLFISTIFTYTKKRNFQVGVSLVQQIRTKFPKLRIDPPASAWKQEAYKLLFVNKGLILILVFSLLILPKITQNNDYLTPDELYYKNYMQHLSGELTEDKEAYLQAEKQTLSEAQEELARIEQLYKDKKITEIQRVQYEQPYQSIMTKQNAFLRVMQYYNNLVQQGGGAFVYDTGYTVLFQGNNAAYFTIIIFCALCFFNLFSMELKNGTIRLIRTLPKGRTDIVKCKVILSLIVCFGIVCIAQVLELLSVNEVYGLSRWTDSIANIPMFSAVPEHLPIWGYAAIVFGLKLLAIINSTMFILLISSINKNGLVSMLLSVFLLAAPIILSFMGINAAQYLTMLTLNGSGISLVSVNGFIVCSVYAGISILSIGLIYSALKRRMML